MVFLIPLSILIGIGIGVSFKNAERDKDTKRLDLFEANIWHAIQILTSHGTPYNWFPSDRELRDLVDEFEEEGRFEYKTQEEALKRSKTVRARAKEQGYG
jgi:hypothetical protein